MNTRDSIRWHPQVTVARYSPGQTAWALRWLLGRPYRSLDGDLLRRLFPGGPEDGFARDEGNSMTAAGLANVAALVAGAGGWPLDAGSAAIGVGSDGGTPFDDAQDRLGAGPGASSWYQPMDPGYPRLAAPALIEGQATFPAAEANWTWAEWCWAVGAGDTAAGPVLAEAFAGPVIMLNRKVPAVPLGSKDSAAWVFVSTVRFR